MTAEASNRRNGAELFVHALENEGVRYIFAVPGEENLDLLEACLLYTSPSPRD